MPYKIVRSDDGKRFCVAKWSDKGTRQQVPGGCHDTYQQALDHMRALYANVEDASKDMTDVPVAAPTADPSESAMVAFFMPGRISETLHTATINAGLTPQPMNDLHVTLIYLGDVAELAARKQALIDCLRQFCVDRMALSGIVNGTGRFQGLEPNPIFANLDSAMLPDYRQQLIQALAGAGFENASEHGFTPHITLAHVASTEPTPTLVYEPMSVNLSALTLAWGNERTTFELAAAQNKAMHSQREVDYQVQSPMDGEQMCAFCAHYTTVDGQRGACDIVEPTPLPIVAQGWCKQWVPKHVESTDGAITKTLPEQNKEVTTMPEPDGFWTEEEKTAHVQPIGPATAGISTTNTGEFWSVPAEGAAAASVTTGSGNNPEISIHIDDSLLNTVELKGLEAAARAAIQKAINDLLHQEAPTHATSEKASGAPTDPDLYAYVPDKDHPSTWKLRIDDKKHVGLAIAALSRSHAPHGRAVQIPQEARAGVIRKISGRIGKLPISNDEKQELRDRLSAFQKKEVSATHQLLQRLFPWAFKDGPGATATADAPALNGPMLDGSGKFGVLTSPGVNRGAYLPKRGKKPKKTALQQARARGDKAYLTPRLPSFRERSQVGMYIDKGLDGRRLMFLITSNSYKDREDETITTKALQRYVESAWSVEGKCIPNNPLLLWHKGMPIGDVIWCDMEGPFLIEVAKERRDAVINLNNPDERPRYASIKSVWDLIESQSKKEAWGASHGFEFPHDAKSTDGTYDAIYKFETSALPLKYAANPYTLSSMIGES